MYNNQISTSKMIEEQIKNLLEQIIKHIKVMSVASDMSEKYPQRKEFIERKEKAKIEIFNLSNELMRFINNNDNLKYLRENKNPERDKALFNIAIRNAIFLDNNDFLIFLYQRLEVNDDIYQIFNDNSIINKSTNTQFLEVWINVNQKLIKEISDDRKKQSPEEQAYLTKLANITPKIMTTLYANTKQTNDENAKEIYNSQLKNIKDIFKIIINDKKLKINFGIEHQANLLLLLKDEEVTLRKIIPKDTLKKSKELISLTEGLVDKYYQQKKQKAQLKDLSDLRTLYSDSDSALLKRVIEISSNSYITSDESGYTTSETTEDASQTSEDSDAKLDLTEYEQQTSSLSAKSSEVDQQSQKISTLSISAAEFFPLQEKINQMNEFLSGERRVKSIDNLPKFLQNKLQQLIDNYGATILIQGSCCKIKNKHETKAPSDLDLIIAIPEMSEFGDEEINNIFKILDLDAKSESIKKRHKQPDGSDVFSFNIQNDQLKLDFSFYDLHKLPNPEKSWSTSEDTRLLLSAESAKFIGPKLEYDKERDTFYYNYKSQNNFFINPQARDLILRIALIKTIYPKRISYENITTSLNDLYPSNPIDLIFDDMKLSSHNPDQQQDIITKKVDDFCNKHQLKDNLRRDFILNMNFLINTYNLEFPHPREILTYQTTYQTFASLLSQTHSNDSTRLQRHDIPSNSLVNPKIPQKMGIDTQPQATYRG